MERTGIEKIVELAAPNVQEIDGRTYTDKRIIPVERPRVKTLELTTLNSLVKLIQEESIDYITPLIVQVSSYDAVEVFAGIQAADRKRENPYRCKAETIRIQFDQKLDYESMMIALKSKFVQTSELLELVKLLGSITEQNSAQVSDDGFSQNVVVRKGIALKDNKTINPIVKLKPYRTFAEIDQPESEFLLRLSDGANVALYEADGGAWKLEARKRIADYLREALSGQEDILIVE